MNASDLIVLLERQIAQHGDMEVFVGQDLRLPIEDVKYVPESTGESVQTQQGPTRHLKEVPEPLYPCGFNECLSTWPAEDLFWSEPLQGWVCDQCWDDVDQHWTEDSGRFDRGISLAQEIKNQTNLDAHV